MTTLNEIYVAELLCQLTGLPGVVIRPSTNNRDAAPRLVTEIRGRVTGGAPVLARTRPLQDGEQRLPRRLIDDHWYEVTEVDDRGIAHLRNPWNHWHPEPLTPPEFSANVGPQFVSLGEE